MRKSFQVGRPKLPLRLSSEQKNELERIVRFLDTPARLLIRARIVLLAAEGKDNQKIATLLKTSHVTVGLWRQRFLDLGLAGLPDAPKSGRPRILPLDKMQIVLKETARPSVSPRRWTCRSMARLSGLSHSTVQRLWSANGIKPHSAHQNQPSTTPNYKKSLWDLVGILLLPPLQAIVLSCDTRNQLMAAERAQPELPLGQWISESREDNEFWQNAVMLFAALDYLNRKISAERAPHSRPHKWLKFLKSIEASIPLETDAHLILDNSVIHKHATVRDWLSKRPRIKVHFKGAKMFWLNSVEQFIADLKKSGVRSGSFAGMNHLVPEIWKQLAKADLKPRQFEWKANLKVG